MVPPLPHLHHWTGQSPAERAAAKSPRRAAAAPAGTLALAPVSRLAPARHADLQAIPTNIFAHLTQLMADVDHTMATLGDLRDAGKTIAFVQINQAAIALTRLADLHYKMERRYVPAPPPARKSGSAAGNSAPHALSTSPYAPPAPAPTNFSHALSGELAPESSDTPFPSDPFADSFGDDLADEPTPADLPYLAALQARLQADPLPDYIISQCPAFAAAGHTDPATARIIPPPPLVPGIPHPPLRPTPPRPASPGGDSLSPFPFSGNPLNSTPLTPALLAQPPRHLRQPEDVEDEFVSPSRSKVGNRNAPRS
jgi:hypothetical protein